MNRIEPFIFNVIARRHDSELNISKQEYGVFVGHTMIQNDICVTHKNSI